MKILSTEGLTKLIQLVKTAFISVDDIDNNTITKNIHDELQASAVMNSRTNVDSLPIWEGTEQQWITGGNQTWYNWSYGNAGISWTDGTGLSDFYTSVVYGNGLYVAVGSNSVSANSSNGQTWREFTTLTGIFNSVTYGNGLFVAVGRNRLARGTFAYSSDGENWTIGSLPAIVNGVTYGNSLFVAVGDRIFAYSSDGQNWMFDTLSDRYVGVTYGNGLFVAIGRAVFAYSSDGENWTESSLNYSDYKAITYGNGLFVAIGSGVFAYSSDGENWTEGHLTSNYNDITYGNGLFVAIGDGAFAYSSDGENWTESSLYDSYQAIAYGNNLFVAIGDYGSCMYGINDSSSVFTITQNPTIGDVIYSSPAVLSALTIVSVGTGTITLSDTKTYNYNPSGNETTISTVGEAHPNWLCHIEGIGVKKGTTLIANLISLSQDDITIVNNINDKLQAVGLINQNTASGAINTLKLWQGTEQEWETGGESEIWYNWLSTSSVPTWTTVTSGTNAWLTSITSGNNKFVAVGDYGTVLTSSDGSSWTAETSGTNTLLMNVTYGNNMFVAVGYNGTILTSSDGSTWSSKTSGTNKDLLGITYGNNKFIAVGSDNIILSSPDGSTWTTVTSGTGDGLLKVIYGNNMFVAVGYNGVILTSSDGSTWNSETTSLGDETVSDVAYGNNMFVAIGEGGSVLTSSNGSTWTAQSPLYDSLNSINYVDGKFFVTTVNYVYSYSRILSSQDGLTWVTEGSGFSESLWDLTYSNNIYITVGENGIILSNTIVSLSCYTNTSEPTTSSIVYSEPNVVSALTISSVATGSITLSDNNIYTYNPSGNEYTYHTVGESYPNWLCNINNVGVKIGNTSIITGGGSSYTAGTNISIVSDTISTSAAQVIIRRL